MSETVVRGGPLKLLIMNATIVMYESEEKDPIPLCQAFQASKFPLFTSNYPKTYLYGPNAIKLL